MARGSRMAHWWPSTSRSATASSLGSTPALKPKWLALSTSSCARTTFSAFWIRVPARPIKPPDSHSTHKETIHGKTDCLQRAFPRSEEHTSELQSLRHLVCRLLLEKKHKE